MALHHVCGGQCYKGAVVLPSTVSMCDAILCRSAQEEHVGSTSLSLLLSILSASSQGEIKMKQTPATYSTYNM